MRQPRHQFEDAAFHAAVVALEAAGLEARRVHDNGDDTMLDVFVDDRPFRVVVLAVAYCTGGRADELIGRSSGHTADAVPLVVADRVTAEARARLDLAGWSWLDRRGRLHLYGPGVRVDVDVPPLQANRGTGATAPIAGRGGLAVAYWLCSHPGEALSPTRSAPVVHLAPSTISTAVRRLAEVGLVDDGGAGAFPELFWELADAWTVERTWLAAAPDPASHRRADPSSSAWRRTGSAAAAAYGAPLVTTEHGPVELYVPGPVDVTIAARRYHTSPPGQGAAAIAVAPVAPVVAGDDETAPIVDGWPAAPLLAVALDLAQDRARGRQILDEWHVPGAVWR